ncbi:MAG: M1 family metallopeptidase [Bacteroidota bacterium]
MKYGILVISFLALKVAWVQSYFQQETNYEIEVELNDSNHMLNGKEQIEYVNHSPDTLRYIYFHLWPNAYKNDQTALAQQLRASGNEVLTQSTSADRGYIDSLNFHIDGEQVNWSFDEEHIDIAKIHLQEPLLPGESCTIATPFRVKIPSGNISRLGHIGESYQITQWYPKPAVYDREGWHEMPYLNQGEFYSEYGSFDVSITLPENYVVGATGDLQTAEEKQFLEQKASETEEKIAAYNAKKNRVERNPGDEYPPSSEKMKTIRYTQKNVHDFAWFADKRYEVLSGEVELPHSGRKVKTWAMFTPRNMGLWQDAVEYINDGTFYYSKWNGDYPYNQVTAVDGTISAGGGMEYPNVTVIGNAGNATALETVIVHEVGHNWFYGIFGSNERDHGWMDEGLNTLNEVRYFMTKYPENEALAETVPFFNFHGLNYHDRNDLLYRAVQAIGEDQPIETHSKCFQSANYGLVMYQKTGLVFEYMRHYLGNEKFDRIMQHYFDEFAFKHPQPADLRRIFEKHADGDVSWLFDDFLNTTKRIEARLGRVQSNGKGYEVTVHNTGRIKGPIPVAVMENDSIIATKWTSPGQRKTTLSFEAEGNRVMIDPQRIVPELSRQNNGWRADGLLKKWEPLKLNMFSGYNWSDETNMHILPLVAGNANDKLMLGAALHNYSIAPNRFNYFLAPLYSLGRQNVSGIGELSYRFHRPGIKSGRVGLSLTSFKDESTLENGNSFFAAAAPYLRFDFGNEDKAYPLEHLLLFQGMAKQTRRGDFYLREFGGFLKWESFWNKGRHAFASSVRSDFIYNNNTSESAGRLMGSASYTYDWMAGSDWKSKIRLRTFAGYNYLFDVVNQSSVYRYGIPLTGANGNQDVFVENFFFDRSSTTHRANNRGGFFTASDFGIADSWMQSNTLFVGVPTPQLLPGQIGAFGNLGIFENDGQQYTPYAMGVGYELGDFFGLYYAILESNNLANTHSGSRFGQRLRVTLHIDLFNSGQIPKLYR